MSIDAMKLALHTLEGWANHGDWVWPESALEQAKRNTTESITALRAAIEQAPWVKSYAGGKPNYTTPEEQTRQWQGLSPFDKTLLRTTYAPMKPLYYDKENDHSVCAEVVTDWDSFFAAIESKLQERNP